jgi:YfiR/HmsC-like
MFNSLGTWLQPDECRVAARPGGQGTCRMPAAAVQQESPGPFLNPPPDSRRCWRSHAARVIRGAVTILLLLPVLASAQDVTEPALKAAFIYNFAKFTEWPSNALPAAEPLVMCVVGDAAVSDALAQAVASRTVAGHRMAVSLAGPVGPEAVCHVLYVSGVTAGQATKLIAALRDVPVLTISDIEGFTELGGIAQFFFEHGRLRFSIRLESVERSTLRISSRLLALAVRK